MARQGKRNTKAQNIDTAGGASIGNDVNAGRDFVGRDSTVINITNNIHHHPPTKTSRRGSSAKPDLQTIEANVANTLIKFYHRWFPYTVLLVALQLVFLPLLFVITDLWPLLILLGGILLVLISFLNSKTEHQLRVAGFYDIPSTGQRKMLIYNLRQKDWGHWSRNWYMALLLGGCVQVDQRRLKQR